jgi:hypothetical protein
MRYRIDGLWIRRLVFIAPAYQAILNLFNRYTLPIEHQASVISVALIKAFKRAIVAISHHQSSLMERAVGFEPTCAGAFAPILVRLTLLHPSGKTRPTVLLVPTELHPRNWFNCT